VNFVVGQRNVVLVDSVPFLNPDFLRPCPGLGGNEQLEVANRVVLTARNKK